MRLVVNVSEEEVVTGLAVLSELVDLAFSFVVVSGKLVYLDVGDVFRVVSLVTPLLSFESTRVVLVIAACVALGDSVIL